jgi:hypothetical protein
MNQADAEFELEAELNRLMTVLERSDLESEAEMFGPAATGPLFDLACAGCAAGQCVPCTSGLCVACPLHGGACRAALRDAILEAIKLANNAANLVDAAVALPSARRGSAEKETTRLYKFFFCHDPATFISWAGGPSGATVSARLRAVARELGGGRRLLFECRPTGGCNAFTIPGVHSTVFLCPPFWADQGLPGLPEVDRRAGTVLHEMLHNLYDLDDATRFNNAAQPTPRRFDAHCYEAFVLRINGFGADQTDVQNCGQAPCEAV